MQTEEWHYSFADSRRGPVSEDHMRKLIVDRTIEIKGCLVWKQGMENWLPLEECSVFTPSVDLVHRLDAAKNKKSDNDSLILLQIADAKRPTQKPNKFQQKFPYFWLSIRTGVAAFSVAYLSAYIFSSIEAVYAIAAILISLAVLFISGPRPQPAISERLLLGCISTAGFLYTSHLVYLAKHSSIIGKSLLATSTINHSAAYFTQLFSSSAYLAFLTSSFIIPFVWVGFFYSLLFALQRHGKYISFD